MSTRLPLLRVLLVAVLSAIGVDASAAPGGAVQTGRRHAQVSAAHARSEGPARLTRRPVRSGFRQRSAHHLRFRPHITVDTRPRTQPVGIGEGDETLDVEVGDTGALPRSSPWTPLVAAAGAGLPLPAPPETGLASPSDAPAPASADLPASAPRAPPTAPSDMSATVSGASAGGL